MADILKALDEADIPAEDRFGTVRVTPKVYNSLAELMGWPKVRRHYRDELKDYMEAKRG
tara:strand:+ start:285 stop:461 length:177 start_codon:yes stop_codon:yes gene_type:complete